MTGIAAALERSLGEVACHLGWGIRFVAHGLPRAVARASGVARPSPTATAAAVARGYSVLASASLGPVVGPCVDAAADAAIFGYTARRLCREAGCDFGTVVFDLDRVGACPPLVAAAWQVSHGAGLRLRHVGRAARATLPRLGGAAVRRTPGARALLDGASFVFLPYRVWSEMGRVARVVTAAEQLARAHQRRRRRARVLPRTKPAATALAA